MKPVTRAYLDANATHPLLPQARLAIMDALELPGNPSSVHEEGRAARRLIEESRRAVAAAVNAKPEHVTFTAGATEAANLLLTPHWQLGRSKLAMGRLYVCAADHPCTLAGGHFDASQMTILPVLSSGEFALPTLEAALLAHDKATGLPLVAIHHANNETGVIQPVGAIAAIVKAHGGILIVDAVQSLGRVPLDISTGCGDFFIVSSHKIGGPKGAGAIVGITDLMMPVPVLRGGGQEKGRRSGTEALPAIAGFGAAAELMSARLKRINELAAMRDRIEAVIKSAAPDAVFHGLQAADRLPNTTFFTLPGMRAETMQISFDLAGVAVSAGSACSSGKVGASHVLKAMGVEGTEGAIRVSLALETTDSEIERFSKALAGIISRRPNQS